MRRLNCYHISKHRVIHRIIAVLTVLTCGSSSSDRLLESSDSCSNLNDSFLWLLCCMLASNMCRNAFPHDCPRCVGSARDYAALLMVLMMCIEFQAHAALRWLAATKHDARSTHLLFTLPTVVGWFAAVVDDLHTLAWVFSERERERVWSCSCYSYILCDNCCVIYTFSTDHQQRYTYYVMFVFVLCWF